MLGVLILAKALLLLDAGIIHRWTAMVPPNLPIWPEFLAGAAIFFATVLPFELLVAIAVRQVRYANAA